MATVKPDPLPADPREALRRLFATAEELKHIAEEARRKVARAIDLAEDSAEKADALFDAIERWSLDHDPERTDFE